MTTAALAAAGIRMALVPGQDTLIAFHKERYIAGLIPLEEFERIISVVLEEFYGRRKR